MARKTYTEEQKAAALAKVEEIGLTKASKELAISATTLSAWKKAAEGGVSAETAAPEAVAEEAPAPKKRGRKPSVKKAVEETKAAVMKAGANVAKGAKKLSQKAADVKKVAKDDAAAKSAENKADKPAVLTPAKQEKLIADNAVLKAEVASLKAEITRLKKAIADLTK